MIKKKINTQFFTTCQYCEKTYDPAVDICWCNDEPMVNDWEDHPFQPARKLSLDEIDS